MLGWLLATSIIVNCTVVNTADRATLACDDRREPLVIQFVDWPTAWHGPELGFTYQLLDGKPVASVRDERKAAREAQQARFHQRRWMRESLQNPRKE